MVFRQALAFCQFQSFGRISCQSSWTILIFARSLVVAYLFAAICHLFEHCSTLPGSQDSQFGNCQCGLGLCVSHTRSCFSINLDDFISLHSWCRRYLLRRDGLHLKKTPKSTPQAELKKRITHMQIAWLTVLIWQTVQNTKTTPQVSSMWFQCREETGWWGVGTLTLVQEGPRRWWCKEWWSSWQNCKRSVPTQTLSSRINQGKARPPKVD